MGTNSAPSLANLFLYAYESAYIDRLLRTEPARAASFHMTFRYIDDTLSIDNPLWQQAIDAKLIYPAQLSLADTTPAVSTDPVHFLGMDIATAADDPSRFRLSVYDKRDDFPFPVRRYPQCASLIPHTIPYGVFLGQLHHGYRICTSSDDFLSFATSVAGRLVSNGCSARRLCVLFSTFVRRAATKYRHHRELCSTFCLVTCEPSVGPSQ